MTDLLLLPPSKRSRSRRLRKKLRIGEFQALGFDYQLNWRVAPSIEVQDRFIDELLANVIEPRALSLGGGVSCGFVAARRGSATEADRIAIESWLRHWPEIAKIEIGQLRDAWYDQAPCKPIHDTSDFEVDSAEAALLAKLGLMIEQSGGASDTTALTLWLKAWLAEPLPDLNGTTPAQALRSESGKIRVETLLERMRGGLSA